MERRIHRRFPRRIELRYWRPGEVQGHTAYTTNISKSGLFLSSSTPLMSGERLRLDGSFENLLNGRRAEWNYDNGLVQGRRIRIGFEWRF